MSVPTALTQVIGFMLLVAPGVAFELAFALRRPNRQRTALQELASVVGVSVFASGAVVVMGLLLLPEDWFLTLRHTALDPAGATRPALVAASAVVGGSVLAASLLAVGAAYLMTRDATAKMFNEPVWFLLFGRRPPGTVPYVVARLNNGDHFYGVIVAYTTAQVPQNERDIVLGPPLYVRWEGATDVQALDGFGRISLSGEAIQTLAISYHVEGAFG